MMKQPRNKKPYTTLEQSKLLSGVLSDDSADNYWSLVDADLKQWEIKNYPYSRVKVPKFSYNKISDVIIPCWSIVPLMNSLKPEIKLENSQTIFLHFNKDISNEGIEIYVIRYTNSWTGEVIKTEPYEDFINSLVEIILKLHEKNLI